MTLERKDEIYGELLNWIFEECDDTAELFSVLCDRIGMTEQELHDSGMHCLDSIFHEDELKYALKEEMERGLADFRNQWLSMNKEELIQHMDEIETSICIAKCLPGQVTGREAESLLQLEKPFDTITRTWIEFNGADTYIPNEESICLLLQLIHFRDEEDEETECEGWSEPIVG